MQNEKKASKVGRMKMHLCYVYLDTKICKAQKKMTCSTTRCGVEFMSGGSVYDYLV